MKKRTRTLFCLLLSAILTLSLCGCVNTLPADVPVGTNNTETDTTAIQTQPVLLENIPAFSDKAYVALNNNIPTFTEKEITDESFEYYSPLDSLGRCGVAYASIGKDLMPTEKREDIGSVKPSGWHTVKFDFVDGKYLYNRCHLIGFQLAGENANDKNLITGTRYMNVEGMLPFENMVADYVKETNNHVMYRVTPIFEGNNLVASGVQMEAWSVEDDGDGICFNIYCYNNQPGVIIDYTSGTADLSETATTTAKSNTTQTYVINTNTQKFHYPDCSSAKQTNEKNKKTVNSTRQELIDKGYAPCGACKP